MRVTITQAKRQLHKLMRQAEAGEEVILTSDGRDAARLVGTAGTPKRNQKPRPQSKEAIRAKVRKSAERIKIKTRAP